MSLSPDARSSVTGRAREVLARIKSGFGREDTALIVGGLTFYSAIAVVPLLILTIWSATVITSPEWVAARFSEVARLLPDALGARAAVDGLAAAGIGASMLHLAIAVFPATFYGEGLRRAITRLSPADESFTGWRGRLAMLPFVVAAPVLLVCFLATAQVLTEYTTGGGVGAMVGRVFIGFNCLWLLLAVPLGWIYRVITPHPVRWGPLIGGSLVTSSIVAGFVWGFVLFLAIPVDLGAPFGGLTVIGGGVAVLLWMFLFHVLVLAGWLVTTALDPRTDPPVGTDPRVSTEPTASRVSTEPTASRVDTTPP